MTKPTLFALTVLFFSGCPGCPPPVPPPPPPPPVIDGPATCADVCRRASELGCKGSDDIDPSGPTCLEVCLTVQDGPALWNLDCRARAVSCAAFDDCEVAAE